MKFLKQFNDILVYSDNGKLLGYVKNGSIIYFSKGFNYINYDRAIKSDDYVKISIEEVFNEVL